MNDGTNVCSDRAKKIDFLKKIYILDKKISLIVWFYMSHRKILFFIAVVLISIGCIFLIWKIGNSKTTTKEKRVDTLTVWVVGDTSEQYNKLFSWFGEYAKAYSKTKIDIQVFSDYSQYRRLLQNTLADGKGPDIFVVDAWGDDALERYILPIPGDIIDISAFEQKYEDIFLPLVDTKEDSWKNIRSLRWVPLGYETLGIFYNKSLLRVIPKTWNDVWIMYQSDILSQVLPTNIGMWPRYTPYATDILAYFLVKSGISDYTQIDKWAGALEEYRSYGDTTLLAPSSSQESVPMTLFSQKDFMDTEKISTIDLFMRGRIVFVVGYPSLMLDIEKAYKRAGNEAVDALILTEKLPIDSIWKASKNLARYSYMSISSKSESPLAAAKLLSYIMQDSSRIRTQDIFPLLISPERIYYDSQSSQSLSTLFTKTKIAPFIPLPWEQLELFHYGNREIFERLFSQDIDRNEKINNNNLLSRISLSIQCELESLSKWTISPACTQEK